MERLLCEVIGCGKRAGWKLLPPVASLPEEVLLEDYLCDEHQKAISILHPDLAGFYVLLEPKNTS
jgi:hypothetical protein